ncbi:MAG: hypothetical protein ABF242_04295, partial [Flavobacteriales bacterium]
MKQTLLKKLILLVALIGVSFAGKSQLQASITSCNQGFTPSGVYKIQYSVRLENPSTTASITGIQLFDPLETATAFNTGCVTLIDGKSIATANRDGNTFPQMYNGGDLDAGFDHTNVGNPGDTGVFNPSSLLTDTLYPRQVITVSYCVHVDPACAGGVTELSGAGVTFVNAFTTTSSNGSPSGSITHNDFHTTETNVAANLHVPVNTPTVNFDGTYDFTNTIIITNDGSAVANNVQFNMSMEALSTAAPAIPLNTYVVTQISGAPMTVNPGYTGQGANTGILAAGQTMASGTSAAFSIAYNVGPTTNSSWRNFAVINPSYSVGAADGQAENSTHSYVSWTDAKGGHVDRYYSGSSTSDVPSSEDQCSCPSLRMRFPYTVSLNLVKTVLASAPSASLSPTTRDYTFQLVATNNGSSTVQIDNVSLIDDLTAICGAANIVGITAAPSFSSSTATTNPVFNVGFDGVGNNNIFDGASGVIDPGQQVTVVFTAEITVPCLGNNSAAFSGDDPTSTSAGVSNSSAVLNSLPVPDTAYFLTGGNPVDTCITTTELIGSNLTYGTCEAPNNGVLTNVDSCFRYTPVSNSLDTACVIICDEYAVCDTTILIFVPPLTNDTIITTSPFVCVDSTEMDGLTFSTISTCDGTGTTTSGGTVTTGSNNCVTITPNYVLGTDTTCIIICDTLLNICDTTIIVSIIPPTPDTIVMFTYGVATDTCLSTSELPGSTFTYTACGNPGNGSISNIDSCYRYIPINNLLDSSCVVICDEYGICDTTYFFYLPPFEKDTIYRGIPATGGTDSSCLSTPGTGGPYDVTSCDRTDGTYAGFLLITDDSCVVYTPPLLPFTGDTACIIICDTIVSTLLCDTTIIIYYPTPTPDTIITQLPRGGGSVVVCADTTELLGSNFTYSSCGGASSGVFSRNSENCYTYITVLPRVDTTCEIVCDENGVCDTTYFIFVPAVTPDTVITTNPIVCVDTTEMPAGYQTITACDGSVSPTTTNGGSAVIDPLTGCVTTTPDFSSSMTDTTCVIVCDTINGICDTTIIITVQPPTPDTIVQFTNGMATAACLA